MQSLISPKVDETLMQLEVADTTHQVVKTPHNIPLDATTSTRITYLLESQLHGNTSKIFPVQKEWNLAISGKQDTTIPHKQLAHEKVGTDLFHYKSRYLTV